MRAFRALLCATLFTQACWSVYPGELHVLTRVAPDVTVPPGASLSLVAGPQGQATIATVTSGNYSTFVQFQTTAPESYPATLRFLVDSPHLTTKARSRSRPSCSRPGARARCSRAPAPRRPTTATRSSSATTASRTST